MTDAPQDDDGDRRGPIEITETDREWTPPPGWEEAGTDAPPHRLVLTTERTQTGKWLIIKGRGYTPGVVPQLTLQQFPGMPSWVRKGARERAHEDGTFTHREFFAWYPPQHPQDPQTDCYVWAHDGAIGYSPFAIEMISAGSLYVLPWEWDH